MRPMARDLLTPVLGGVTRDLARGLVFRKQILPIIKIDYDGTKLTFDKSYLRDLVASFKDGAYDQVPFTLATDDNRHSADPERIRGEVTSISLAQADEEPGLYATIAFPSQQAARAVLMNPRLGVSCRIVEGVEKADGRHYSKALAHVCGTPDPRVTGMSAWKKVDLAGSDSANQIDLSTTSYTEAKVPKQKKETAGAGGTGTATADEVDFSQWSDEELRALASELGVTDEQIASFIEGIERDPGDGDDDDDSDDDGDPNGAGAKRELVGAGADLSTVYQVAQAAGQRAEEALSQLAAGNWAREKQQLIGQGVPPAAIDLCEKYLAAPGGFVVDLSNSDGSTAEADVAKDIRGLLGMLSGYVDLSNELGHGGQFQESTDADPDGPMLAAWESQFPG